MADDDTGGDDAKKTSTLIAVKKVEKDEERAIKKRKLELETRVRNAAALLDILEQCPWLFGTNTFQPLRDRILAIADNPRKYPRTPQAQGWGKTAADLTKKIGTGMYHRTLSTNDLDGDPIILQVVQTEDHVVHSTIGSSSFSTRKLKMAAIDGDGMPIMLRVDSTLNAEAATMLTKGTIVAIPSFITLYFNYDDEKDLRCALVARSFERVGYQPIDAGIYKNLHLNYTVQETTEKATQSCAKPAPGCNCGGKLCSKYGLNFIVCLTECIPVESISLELVIRDCVFVTKTLEEMTNSDKRFLLYYYYATSVYQFHGKGNRVELPNCLIAAVRALHPPEKMELCTDEVEMVAQIVDGDMTLARKE